MTATSTPMPEFFQDGPQLGNQYADDPALRACLARWLPGPVLTAIEPGLHRLGARAAGDLLALAQAAEAAPPQHVPYDPWGRRVDAIRTSPAWQALERAAAEEAVVATAYRREEQEHARLHQFARLYLYHPSSALYSCPLAMTDGAARLIELHGDAYLQEHVLPRLTSTDPATFWTSGQWMTERSGGSDVGGTATVARRTDVGWALYGSKWFTSATTAQIAFTLARIETAGAAEQELSLFYLELRDPAGRLRNIEIHRLKDKLGTRALPTAELSLHGTPAQLVGKPGQGVRTISTILNITRLYNACCAAAAMRRGLALARDYAGRRRVFGKLLADQPLHAHTLHLLDTEQRAALQLVFYLAHLLGREETGHATAEERTLLRLLTPVAKLYTGKQAVAASSETLECFGGAGYIEDTGLPGLLRDAQVLTIWEGTTNVLSLDLLRALRQADSGKLLLQTLQRKLDAITAAELRGATVQAGALLHTASTQVQNLAAASGDDLQRQARQLAYLLARTVGAALLLEQAQWTLSNQHPDADAACRAADSWCASNGAPLAQG